MSPVQPALLRNAAYLRLWGSQALGAVSQQACLPVWPLLVLALTGSAAAAGLVAAIRSLPFLILSLPVGVIVDRHNRATLLVVSAAGRVVIFGVLLLTLFLSGPSVLLIYVVVAIEGALFVVFNLAEVAALPSVVPKEQLASANAQNESTSAVVQVAAPALGSFLYQVAGVFAAALVSAVCSVAAMFLVAKLQLSQPPRSSERSAFLVEIAAGFRWLRDAKLIAFLACLTALLNFLSAGLGVIAVIAAKRYGATDLQVGAIFSLAGLGAAIGALAAPWLKSRLQFDHAIRGVVVLTALLVPLFVASNQWLTIGIVYFLINVLSPIYNVFQVTFRLERIPTELQGRVNSTYRLIAFGLFPLGAAAAGFLLESTVPGLAGAVFTSIALAAAVLACVNVTSRSVAAAG